MPGVRDEPAHVGEAEAVARGRAEDRELGDEALARGRAPATGAMITITPRMPTRMPAICTGLELLDAEQQAGHDRRHDRRRRVVDAREARRDVLLRPREEQERHDAERHGEHRHVAPRPCSARGSASRRRRDEQPERERAEHEPRPRDLARGRGPSRATFMNRKLEPQMMPVSDELHGDPRGRPGPSASAGGRGAGGGHAATLARGIRRADRPRDATSEIPPMVGRSGVGQGSGCSASYARKRGFSRTSSATRPDDDEAAEQAAGTTAW